MNIIILIKDLNLVIKFILLLVELKVKNNYRFIFCEICDLIRDYYVIISYKSSISHLFQGIKRITHS